MADLRFVWDPRKAKSNTLKHQVTFAEAESVFYDENAFEYPDPDIRRLKNVISSLA